MSSQPIDVRFVATTSSDLEAAAHVMVFRLDLLFRLMGFTLTVPPLRERTDEIERLARRFLADASENRTIVFSSAVLDLFRSVAWPRNVTQLREVIATAYSRCTGPEITPEHVDAETLRNERPTVPRSYEVPADDGTGPPDLTPAARYERARIIAALSDTKGNATRVAASLSVTRRMLIAKLDRYRIPRPRPPGKTE
jgi:DNA-binding NtrC family response regulator